MQLAITVGATSRGIGRDLFPAAAQYLMAMIQLDTPVGADELNMIQQIAEERTRNFGRAILKGGLCWGGYVFDSPNADNTLYLGPSYFDLDGLPMYVANPDGSGNRITIGLPAAPGTTGQVRSDLLMLEFWFEEVADAGEANGSRSTVYKLGGVGGDSPGSAANGTLTNDIQNPILTSELARRVQLLWRVRVESGVTTLDGATMVAQGAAGTEPTDTDTTTYPSNSTRRFTSFIADDHLYRAGDPTNGTLSGILKSVTGYVYAFPLGVVRRVGGQPKVVVSDITTPIPMAEIRIRVPRSVIYPPLPPQFPGESIFPERYFYQGQQADGQGGSGTTALALASSSYAVKFTAPSTVDFTGGGTTITLQRGELHLQKIGTGANVVVQIRTNLQRAVAGVTKDLPDTTVLGTFTIPKQWLTGTARLISFPIGLALSPGAKYWLVALLSGDGVNGANVVGEVSVPADTTHTPLSSATSDGSAWTTGSGGGETMNVANPIHFGIFAKTDGAIRNTQVGVANSTLVTELYEFAPDGTLLYIGSQDINQAWMAVVTASDGGIVLVDYLNAP